MFWIGIRCFPYGSGLPILTSKANKALPIPSHPILCIIISLVSLIELKAKQAVVAPLIVMYFLSIRLQLKKKKGILKQTSRFFFFYRCFSLSTETIPWTDISSSHLNIVWKWWDLLLIGCWMIIKPEFWRSRTGVVFKVTLNTSYSW